MGRYKSLNLLDKEAAADYIGVHPYSIWRMVREGRLPQGVRYKGDKKKYWAQESLDVYLQRLDDAAFIAHENFVRGT